MIVVSDTSPITSLVKIDRLYLLERLFRRVLIPDAVHKELQKSHSSLPAFIEVCSAKDRELVLQLAARLDQGEAEAIVLAKELNAKVLLIDERLGRSVAKKEGLKITGLMGVLIEAKQRKFITSVEAEIGQLEVRAGFRISKAVRADALRLAGER